MSKKCALRERRGQTRRIRRMAKLEIRIKKLDQDARIPTRRSGQAAGYDLYAKTGSAALEIRPGETAKIGTGIAVEIPDGYFGAVFARSGLVAKKGLRPANCVGVIDSDYRGEIFVPLHNDSGELQTIADGGRIAQLIILPYMTVDFTEADELSETERGEGGFGSTGI